VNHGAGEDTHGIRRLPRGGRSIVHIFFVHVVANSPRTTLSSS
jgi:hypothetical protein